MMLAILGSIIFFATGNHFQAGSTTFRCKVVDEFYDDTSNYWEYNPIYHLVVEYNDTFNLEDATAYSMEVRADYEHWFEEVEVIVITYFEKYTDRDAIYEAEFQRFLLPLSD